MNKKISILLFLSVVSQNVFAIYEDVTSHTTNGSDSFLRVFNDYSIVSNEQLRAFQIGNSVASNERAGRVAASSVLAQGKYLPFLYQQRLKNDLWCGIGMGCGFAMILKGKFYSDSVLQEWLCISGVLLATKAYSCRDYSEISHIICTPSPTERTLYTTAVTVLANHTEVFGLKRSFICTVQEGLAFYAAYKASSDLLSYCFNR